MRPAPLLSLVALLAALSACSSSSDSGAGASAGASGATGGHGTGGNGAAGGASGACKLAADCPCFSCACPDGTATTSRACVDGGCYGGGLACGLVCTPAIGAVSTLDPTGAACLGGPSGKGGSGGAGGSGAGQCAASQNPFDPTQIDCVAACSFFGMHPSDACANPYAADAANCAMACEATNASSPYTNALWGCAPKSASCDAWMTCLHAKCG